MADDAKPTRAQHLLTKLLDYVIEQSKDVDPRGFRLSQHRGFIKAKPDLQGLPGVDFDIKVDGDHVWLRVARLEAARPPQIDDAVRRFVLIADDPAGSKPRIDEQALQYHLTQHGKGASAGQQAANAERLRSRVEQALQDYVPLWDAWAVGELPRRKVIALYGDLFAIKHQMEAEETAKPHELVWGIGVAAWVLPYAERAGTSSVDFQYPLLTQALEVSLDERTLAIEVRPRSVDPRVEFDAFAACQLPATAEVERSARQALAQSAERQLTPFDPASFEYLLKLIAGNMHHQGSFMAGAETFPSPGADLVVSDAWVILSRPRSNNYLHEDIERLKGRLDSGCAIPEGPLALVTPPSDESPSYEPVHFRGLSGGGSLIGAGAKQELHFPLPYNHEQVTIVEQLERSSGVAVQGPPGTGKTHTIANIVCHYLASGKKVLVTAKGEKALEVLQSKMPEAVRPLTVALLSGDREGMRQFQTSIEAIIHNVSQLNPGVVRSQLESDQSAIERAHQELGAIDRRVDEIAMAQLTAIEVDGVEMRAQKMAELVLSGQESHGWFDDVLTLDAMHVPPLSAEAAAQLREGRRQLGTDIVYVTARIPSSAGLLPAADVGHLHRVLLDMRAIQEAEASGRLLPLRATNPEVLAAARGLLEAVGRAAELARELEETGEVWTAKLREKCRQPTFDSERQALEALFDDVDTLVQARAEFLKRPVELPEQALSSKKAREAISRGAERAQVHESERRLHASRNAQREELIAQLGRFDDTERLARIAAINTHPVAAFPEAWAMVSAAKQLPAETKLSLCRRLQRAPKGPWWELLIALREELKPALVSSGTAVAPQDQQGAGGPGQTSRPAPLHVVPESPNKAGK